MGGRRLFLFFVWFVRVVSVSCPHELPQTVEFQEGGRLPALSLGAPWPLSRHVGVNHKEMCEMPDRSVKGAGIHSLLC